MIDPAVEAVAEKLMRAVNAPDEVIYEVAQAAVKAARDHLLNPNPEFEAWVATLDPKHWAKNDLSACRLGWEAGRAAGRSEP